MMVKNYISNFIFIVYLLFSGCEKKQHPDLIEFVKMDAGRTDTLTLEELFYTEDYKVQFDSAAGLSLKYDLATKKLICFPKSGFSGLTFIPFSLNGIAQVIPVIVRQKTLVDFRMKVGKEAKNVFVMGSFNSWNRTSHPMSDPDGDGIYHTTIPLDDGMYEYQFVIDRWETPDPQNPEKVDNGFGGFNSVLRVSSQIKSLAPRLYYLSTGGSDTLKLSIHSSATIEEINITVLKDNQLLADDIALINDKRAEINLSDIGHTEGLHTLRIVAVHNNIPGNIITLWLKDGKIKQADDIFIWQDAVIYSLMIDRFLNGDYANDRPVIHPELDERANFQGGDFAGITQKIEEGYFDSLGVNTLWISPVTKTTDSAFQEWPQPKRYFSGYHGYWPVAARETEPRFGSLAELKKMVHTAHKHGLRVLLDFISHHVHKEHPYYQDHPDWFGTLELQDGNKNIRLWDTHRLTTWFDTFLPSFDFTRSDEAIEQVTDDAIWWLTAGGIDGFRHDATKHVPYPFWHRLTAKIKKEVNPERKMNVFQIGETFGSDDLIKSYVNNAMQDAQFNFNQFFTARRIFTDPQSHFQDLATALEKSLDTYGYNHVMANIMDSHDQVRMMALLEGDITLADDPQARAWREPKIMVDDSSTYKKERLFLTYLLTVPGIPIIYYGDEIGITGAGDPDNRRMMRFSNFLNAEEYQQLKQVSKLIHIRKKHTALRRGDYLPLYCDQNVFIYSRGDCQERLLIVLNKGDQEKEVKISLPQWLTGNKVISLINNKEKEIINRMVNFDLSPWSGDIFLVK
jgi:cyclomaltodextrinase